MQFGREGIEGGEECMLSGGIAEKLQLGRHADTYSRSNRAQGRQLARVGIERIELRHLREDVPRVGYVVREDR
jgi:hypothetical protein